MKIQGKAQITGLGFLEIGRQGEKEFKKKQEKLREVKCKTSDKGQSLSWRRKTWWKNSQLVINTMWLVPQNLGLRPTRTAWRMSLRVNNGVEFI